MQGDLEVLKSTGENIHRHQKYRVGYDHVPKIFGDGEIIQRKERQEGPKHKRHVQLQTPIRLQDPAVQEMLRGVELLDSPFLV